MIPVVFICDNNYAMPTAVAITSLLENKAHTTEYDIVVICNELSQGAEEKLKQAGGGALRFLKLSNQFIDAITSATYVSPAAIYKFEIPNALPEYNKAIYLDSDVIINSDLTELFNIDTGKNYAGVVKDLYSYISEHDNIRLNKEIYFNTGVLLLNLKKMREDNIPQKLFDEKKVNLYAKYMDQDIFNIVMGDNIKLLSPAYNFMLRNKKDLDLFSDIYSEQVPSRPAIIHCTPSKPWLDNASIHFKLWYKYYKKSPYKREKLPAFRNAKIKFRQRLINGIFQKFGYKILRVIPPADNYKILLNQKGANVDLESSVVSFPVLDLKLRFNSETELKEIYEIFVQERFGFKPNKSGWTVVDAASDVISPFYFACLQEVREVVTLLPGNKDDLACNLKLNPALSSKIKMVNFSQFDTCPDNPDILCKFSINESNLKLLDKLCSAGLIGQANIIVCEWSGFGSEMIKKKLLDYGYRLLFNKTSKYKGIITAVK